MIDTPTDTPERPTYGSFSATPPPEPAPPRRAAGPLWPWLIAAIALAFGVGMVVNPWFETAVRTRVLGPARPAAPDPVIAAQARALTVLQARFDKLQAADSTPGTTPEGERMARIETRLDALQSDLGALGEKVDGAVSGAAAGAAQVQGVLLATAARRAIETGQPLGALEPALRARYGESYPGPVEAIVAGAARPVTLARLRQDFAKLRPALAAAASANGDWWSAFKSTLGGIVAVRRTGEARADPAAQASLAQQRLDAGDVTGAADLIARLPATPAAAAWLADARRWRAAQAALAQIEAAALAPPPAT